MLQEIGICTKEPEKPKKEEAESKADAQKYRLKKTKNPA